MTGEDRARILATLNGWYINENEDFENCFARDLPDVVTNISPTDPDGWGMLCNMESVPVPEQLDEEIMEAAQARGLLITEYLGAEFKM